VTIKISSNIIFLYPYYSIRQVLKERVFIAICLSALLAWTPSMLSATIPSSVEILPPESNPYGLTYGQHVENFWKWMLPLPKDLNPWDDQTGEKCANGQSESNSSVFYLSGNGGGKSDRTCKVPSGKGLFIPVSPMEISDREAPNSSVEQLHSIAKSDQDSVTSLYLKIDDKEYNRQDLSQYRTDTGDFEVVFPENAIFGATAGPSKAVADGYYVITEPLEKGNHTVVYKSTLSLPFAQDITYNIIAE
jgi:hypothetical protein